MYKSKHFNEYKISPTSYIPTEAISLRLAGSLLERCPNALQYNDRDYGVGGDGNETQADCLISLQISFHSIVHTYESIYNVSRPGHSKIDITMTNNIKPNH